MSLEETRAAFATWRGSRVNAKEKIPLHLKQMAKALIPNYKKSAICKALHLSGQQLKQYCLTDKDQNSLVTQNDNFVEARVSPLPQTDIELSLCGQNKSLKLKVPLPQLALVLPILGALV
jgi:hypothetical protein